jgi:hypothetical protein
VDTASIRNSRIYLNMDSLIKTKLESYLVKPEVDLLRAISGRYEYIQI